MVVTRRKAPGWFTVAGVLLTVWGMLGCYACAMQFLHGAEAMGPATEYDRTLYASLPVWYNSVYAVAVATGFAGAVALLVRSALARPLFLISLIAVIIQFGWLFATTDIVAHKGAATVLPFPVLIVAIAAFGAWLAGRAIRRGWIG